MPNDNNGSKTPKKAVGYIRVSTTAQAKEGESLSTQEEVIKKYCEKEEIELTKIYKDQGISGGSINGRPGLLTLLEDIKKFGVQFEWECPPHALKFVCKPEATNRLVIAKGDPGKPDVYQIHSTHCRQSEQHIGLIDIPKDNDVLFLHTSNAVMTDLQQVRTLLIKVDAYVKQCLPRWTNSWAVSFFTEAKMAGFLQDVQKDQYFKEGLWQEANIGQYSSQVRKLYRFPWLKKKRDETYLSVYHGE